MAEDKQTLSDLYKILKSNETNLATINRDYSFKFITVIVGLIGATTGYIISSKHPHPWIILLSPVIGLLGCVLAHSISKGIRRREFEDLSIMIKIESILGLDSPWGTRHSSGTTNDSPIPFSQDRWLLPNRWMDERSQFKDKSSENFINKHIGFLTGSNWPLNLTFVVLYVANVILGLVILPQVYWHAPQFTLDLGIDATNNLFGITKEHTSWMWIVLSIVIGILFEPKWIGKHLSRVFSRSSSGGGDGE